MNTFAAFLLAGTAIATRQSFVYKNDKPSDFDAASNTCTSAQNEYLLSSAVGTQKMAQASIATTKFNTDVYKKWFGDASNEQPDSDVLSRMVDATAMLTKMGKSWNPVCCNKGSAGACGSCGGSTMAFVTSLSWSNGLVENSTWVRFCDNFWKLTDEQKTPAGFVIYHELIHMTSFVGDGYGSYSKSGGVTLAANEPAKARMQANNYMLYAMQNSMSPYNYAKESTSWGNSVLRIGCEDSYSNCPDLVKDNECCDVRDPTGSQLDGYCCASCGFVNATAKCKAALQKAEPQKPTGCVKDKYSNCADLARQTKCASNYNFGGEKPWVACCKSCAQYM